MPIVHDLIVDARAVNESLRRASFPGEGIVEAVAAFECSRRGTQSLARHLGSEDAIIGCDASGNAPFHRSGLHRLEDAAGEARRGSQGVLEGILRQGQQFGCNTGRRENAEKRCATEAPGDRGPGKILAAADASHDFIADNGCQQGVSAIAAQLLAEPQY